MNPQEQAQFETLLAALPADKRDAILAAAEAAAGKGTATVERTESERPPVEMIVVQPYAIYGKHGNGNRDGKREISRYQFVPSAPPPTDQVGGKAAQRRLRQLAKKSA